MNSSGIRVGFGRVSIIPNYSVPLLGYGNSTSRMSQGYLNPVEISCTAIQDHEGKTVLLFSQDHCFTCNSVYKYTAPMVREAIGVADANILLSSTHTHSGADMTVEHESAHRYEHDMLLWTIDAAKLAMADLAPATLQTGSAQVQHMNFVRHYVMNDGTYYGDNFGSRESGYKCHAHEPDKKLQVIKVVREGEKKDILLVNWQAHPKLASTISTASGRLTRHLLSSDYVGYMREYVGKKANCEVAFFLGAAGNLNPLSEIKEVQATVPENPMIYGQKIGDYVLEAMENMKTVPSAGLQYKKVLFPAQIDHSEDHKVEDAKLVVAEWEANNNYQQNVEFGKPYGIMSPYHASSILGRAANPEKIREMEINAVCVGGVGFATVPYEMFLQNGVAVRDGSPFETTFMITCCNGVNAYIAADAAFEYGSYEVHNRTFVRGTGEAVQDKLIEMLNSLK